MSETCFNCGCHFAPQIQKNEKGIIIRRTKICQTCKVPSTNQQMHVAFRLEKFHKTLRCFLRYFYSHEFAEISEVKLSCLRLRDDNVFLENFRMSVPSQIDTRRLSLFYSILEFLGMKKRNESSFFLHRETLDKLLLQLQKIIENKKVGIVPLCGNPACEEALKTETKGAKAVFISDEKVKKGSRCIICGKEAVYDVYAGKTY